MLTNQQHIQNLLDRYLTGTCTPQEQAQVEQWLEQQQLPDNEWQRMNEQQRKSWISALYSQIQNTIADNNKAEDSNRAERPASVHRVHFLRTAWFRYAAAILLLAGIGAAAYVFLSSPPEAPGISITPGNKHQNIAPGTTKAILTLANGKKIELDQADQGKLIQSDGVEVTTPRGGQYQITLPDGTKVWLNAASSIKFPTSFTGAERRVQVTGETFFEVAVNKSRPFVVSGKGMEIQVLGTSFNVNAYEDEEAIKATLIDGSVKVNALNRGVVITPGQQALLSSPREAPGISNNPEKPTRPQNLTIQPVDINETIAWKNGLFNFNGLALRAVMRQLERWYDIKVKYEGEISNITFRGEMYRNVHLSDVLEVLKRMGINFRMEEKTLVVFK